MRRRLVAIALLAVPLAAILAYRPAVADDAKTLQALVDKGGHVRIPAGTYRIETPLVIDLEKTGFTCIEGGTVARIVMAGPGPAIRFVGHHEGTAAPKSVKPLVWDRERMPGLDGVEIVGGHPEADGVEASGTMMLTITRLHVRDCRHGIHLVNRNRNVAIADCHIYQNRGIGIFLDSVNLHQINVTGSHVSYNDDGGIVVRGGEVRNLHITGCDIESNHGKDRPPTANVYVDSRGGSHAEVAITGNTIQHNHEAPGSANIRIQGPSVARAKIDELRDGHVTITGNILSDVHTNVHLDHARGVVVTGNTFWTAYSHNLLVEHSAHVVVGPNAMDRNPRYRGEESPTTTNCVIFRDSSDCTITGLHVSGVKAAKAGMEFTNCDRFHVTGCTVLDCEPVGVLLKNVTRSRFSGFLIRDDRDGAKSLPTQVEGGFGNWIEWR